MQQAIMPSKANGAPLPKYMGSNGGASILPSEQARFESLVTIGLLLMMMT